MMGTEIFKIDAPWAEKMMKMRVQLLLTPSVGGISKHCMRFILNFVKHRLQVCLRRHPRNHRGEND